ncbi:MAG: radical SAM protein, partial [Chloroflexi bacterium]|nr:radical SAM protein [Chloroflexota bacterium]
PPTPNPPPPTPLRVTLPPLDRYAALLRDGEALPAGYVEATHGCKHTCTHCPITPVYGGRFFAVPMETVLADVRQQVAAGARHITFGDPDFLNGPIHGLRIARAMHAAFPDLTFDATIKIEHLLRHANLLPELHDLGCAFVVSAVESLSDTVLAKLHKGHTAADVSRALDLTEQAAIPLRPSLLPFTPWSTLDDFLELLHFVNQRGMIDAVDPVQYSIRLLLPPGSPLLDDADASGWLGQLDAEAFSYRWTHPDARMDALQVAVSALAAQGERDRWDVRRTFNAISAAAHRAAGRDPAPEAVTTGSQRRETPRLTESWFC